MSILSNSDWLALSTVCRDNYAVSPELLFGYSAFSHCRELHDAVLENSLVSVVSEAATGRTTQIALLALSYLFINPNARIVILSEFADRDVGIGMRKFANVYWPELARRYPWVNEYFHLNEGHVCVKGDALGSIELKNCKVGSEELLSGECAEQILWIVDGAENISDKAFQFIEPTLESDQAKLVLFAKEVGEGYFSATRHDDKWIKLHFESPAEIRARAEAALK